MENRTFPLPLNPEFRSHVLATIEFMEVYILYLELGDLPDPPSPDTLAHLTDAFRLRELKHRFELAGETDTVTLDPESVNQLYLCYMLSSRLLVTEQGEYIGSRVLQHVEPDHFLKEFLAFRQHNLMWNTLLIRNTEEALKDWASFREMKQELELLEL